MYAKILEQLKHVKIYQFITYSYKITGTTWTQEIVYLALNGGDAEKAQQSHTWTRIPYLESKLHLPQVFIPSLVI